jgi:hypothetical protein
MFLQNNFAFPKHRENILCFLRGFFYQSCELLQFNGPAWGTPQYMRRILPQNMAHTKRHIRHKKCDNFVESTLVKWQDWICWKYIYFEVISVMSNIFGYCQWPNCNKSLCLISIYPALSWYAWKLSWVELLSALSCTSKANSICHPYHHCIVFDRSRSIVSTIRGKLRSWCFDPATHRMWQRFRPYPTTKFTKSSASLEQNNKSMALASEKPQ